MAESNISLRGFEPKTFNYRDFKKWKWVEGREGWYRQLYRFVKLNQSAFAFLDVNVRVDNVKQTVSLTRSRYTGVVPLRHPANGLYMGSLTVEGSYGEEVAEILAAMNGELNPEFDPTLELQTECPLVPPVFMECLRYIDLYEDAARAGWRKFSVEHRTDAQPRGRTLWGRYVQQSETNPHKAFVFENRVNTLTQNHREWRQLRGVLRYALDQIESSTASPALALQVCRRASRLRPTLTPGTVDAPAAPPISALDPPPIKVLKASATKIMQQTTAQRCAWRVDMAEFFERYVQHLLKGVVAKKGGTVTCNHRIGISGNSVGWGLRYLEPDAVLKVNGRCIAVDAKYKSHMYNLYATEVDDLRDTFRHDLHQVLAYSTFGSGDERHVWLVYPSGQFAVSKQWALSGLMGHVRANIMMIGVPLRAAAMRETVEKLAELVAAE